MLSELRDELPGSAGRYKYTRKAFRMLPDQNEPRILDIGCGTGGPTLELARLSNGQITGLDINQNHLDVLKQKILDAGLSDRVETVRCSMFEMDFPDESFDVVWVEGSIFIIGFERGLKEWRRFIKPRGFLVVHEMAWLRAHPPGEICDYWKRVYPGISTVAGNLKKIPGCGYRAVGHFALPEDFWQKEYCLPMERRIGKLLIKYRDDPEALGVLERERKNIELFTKYRRWYGSAFYVMQKR